MGADAIKGAIAECFGSFALLFSVSLTYCFRGEDAGTRALVVASGFVALYYALAKNSKAHLNPAVSILMLLKGQIGVMELIGYIIGQFGGAIVGTLAGFGFVEMVIQDLDEKSGTYYDGAPIGLKYISDDYTGRNTFAALLSELIFSFCLCYAVMSVYLNKQAEKVRGLVIGAAYALTICGVFGFNQSTLNPAASLALGISQPTYFSKTYTLETIWIWIVGPIAGALGAFGLSLFLEESK